MTSADRLSIAIVGAGPAGLSVAGRAASHDREGGTDALSYVLLEGFNAPAKTIQRYQLGKHVMAEPGFLDLRSDFPFELGSREAALDAWDECIRASDMNIRYDAEVTRVDASAGAFRLHLKGGDEIDADNVVLAIGREGSPRKLGIEGEDLPLVQYQLDDPKAYSDETIVVVGAGDSAIENALALGFPFARGLARHQDRGVGDANVPGGDRTPRASCRAQSRRTGRAVGLRGCRAELSRRGKPEPCDRRCRCAPRRVGQAIQCR